MDRAHPHRPEGGFGLDIPVQAGPLLFTHNALPIFLGDMFAGHPAFLVGGGPSLDAIDTSRLGHPGVLTMALNDAARSVHPNLWTCADDPSRFDLPVWSDPTVIKFVPHHFATAAAGPRPAALAVAACPSVFFFMRGDEFDPHSFLEGNTVSWGEEGARSVLPAALRLLHHLGVRHVFLLGIDFQMSADRPYHFTLEVTEDHFRSNNRLYPKLASQLARLRPCFEEHGFNVYNCNERSRLEVFPFVPFEEALALAAG